MTGEFPGSVAVCGLDADGNEIDVTPDMWKDCFLSAACRHIQRVGEAPIYPCMKVTRIVKMSFGQELGGFHEGFVPPAFRP